MENVPVPAEKGRLRYLLVAVPIFIAVAMPLWQSQLEYGWLELALGHRAWLFWITVSVWGLTVILAIRTLRVWWVLVTAPPVLYPVGIAIALLIECSKGNCL